MIKTAREIAEGIAKQSAYPDFVGRIEAALIEYAKAEREACIGIAGDLAREGILIQPEHLSPISSLVTTFVCETVAKRIRGRDA